MNPEFVKLGVTASSLSEDVRQAARLARLAGFAGIEFDAGSPGLDLTALSASGRREFLLLLRSQDQQLAGLGHGVGAKGFAPGADVDRELARLDSVLESAAAMAAPLVCVDLGALPEPQRIEPPQPKITEQQAGLILLPMLAPAPTPPAPTSPPPDPSFLGQVDAALIELGRLADRYSVVVAFRSELASFAALERALRAVDCPWFGIDFDPTSALRDESELDEIFSRVGILIRHVRGRDAIKGSGGRTKPVVIGQGNVDWGAVLANLSAAGYRGWLTIDTTDLPNRSVAAQEGKKKVLLL